MIKISIFFMQVILFFYLLTPGYVNACAGRYESRIIQSKTVEEFADINGMFDPDENILYPGDKEFYLLWIKGLEQELNGCLDKAIRSYSDAYKIERFELTTYEVLLPLGRAYLLAGQREKADSTLKDFLSKASYELEHKDEGPWGLTPSGEEELKEKMVFAKWLLGVCR